MAAEWDSMKSWQAGWDHEEPVSAKQLLCVSCMVTGRSLPQWLSTQVWPRLETWIVLLCSLLALPSSLFPAISRWSRQNHPASSRTNSFLCWLALYENLIVIANRLHIRVRQRWRVNWLWKEYSGRKIKVVVVLWKKQLFRIFIRCVESLGTTLARGQHCHQRASEGSQYMPHNGQIEIPFDWMVTKPMGF